MTSEVGTTGMGIGGVIVAWLAPYFIDLLEFIPSDLTGWLKTVAQIGGLILLYYSIMLKRKQLRNTDKNEKDGDD